jgi:hypothetical protein
MTGKMAMRNGSMAKSPYTGQASASQPTGAEEVPKKQLHQRRHYGRRSKNRNHNQFPGSKLLQNNENVEWAQDSAATRPVSVLKPIQGACNWSQCK